MKMSTDCSKVVPAFISAQGTLERASKDADNPFFKSKYADLSAVWLACQEALGENGLAVIQDVTTSENGVEVSTRVLHISGQWLECGPLTIPLAKSDAQGVGSAITYGRRYGLSATLGIVTELDDDGNAASKHGKTLAPKVKTSVTVSENSYLIVVEGYKDPEAKIRAWTKKFCAMTNLAEDLDDLKRMQSDNMQAIDHIKKQGQDDPIVMSIAENHRRLTLGEK
jgi:hypothetical protein|tara:strand:- start:2679 stop:3353 length:675 start_codon:yes stop_codon:yes gene_type:complete